MLEHGCDTCQILGRNWLLKSRSVHEARGLVWAGEYDYVKPIIDRYVSVGIDLVEHGHDKCQIKKLLKTGSE